MKGTFNFTYDLFDGWLKVEIVLVPWIDLLFQKYSKQFSIYFDSRVVVYNHRAFNRLATGLGKLMFEK